MNLVRACVLSSAILASSCAAPPPKCAEAPAKPAASASGEASAPRPDAAPGPRVAITIHAVPGADAVEVEVRASADPEALARFSLRHPGGAAALRVKSARDDRGAMALVPEARADGKIVVTLPRRASGEVELSYAIAASARPGSTGFGVDPDANRFLADGEPLLLLPDGLDDRAVRATITIEHERYVTHNDQAESMEIGASSFGVGTTREVSARGGELRRAVYLAGMWGARGSTRWRGTTRRCGAGTPRSIRGRSRRTWPRFARPRASCSASATMGRRRW
jgi:hypothetical protein